jgi:hypothetical protein
VDHKLHAAAFVEEALGHDSMDGGHGAQGGAAGQDVVDCLFGAEPVEAALALEEIDGG